MGFNIVPGIGPARLKKLLDYFGDAEKAASDLKAAASAIERNAYLMRVMPQPEKANEKVEAPK